MSRSLKSIPENQRQGVVDSRLRGNNRGLGYFAAVDHQFRVHGIVVELDQKKPAFKPAQGR